MPIKNPTIKFKKLLPDAIIPTYAHPGDAGFDLYAIESGSINAGDRQMIPLAISSEIPEDWAVIIKDKSGLANEFGIHVLGGVIDSGYRGEWKVVLNNSGKKTFEFEKGQKITQGIAVFVPQAKIVEVSKLTETDRGVSGFGSTGKK